MSMFYCRACQEHRDSDDGAHDILGTLICADCVDATDDDDDEAAEALEAAKRIVGGFETRLPLAVDALAVARALLSSRACVLEEAARAIEAKHTNNVGMVHPMAMSDAATIRALAPSADGATPDAGKVRTP